MSLSLWLEAFVTVVYLINQLPKHNLRFLSSYQKLFGQLLNLAKLQVCGYLCYPWLRPYNSHKLESKSKPCVFIGYSLSQSAYIYLNPTTHKTYTSWHAKFVEPIFPFATSNPLSPFSFIESQLSPYLSTLTPTPTSTPPLNISLAFPPSSNSVPYLEAQVSNDNRGLISSPSLSSPNIFVQMLCLSVPNQSPCQPIVSSSPVPALLPLPTLNPPPISRINLLNRYSMITCAKNNIVKPSTKITMLATTLTEPITEPTCVSQALKDPR